MRKNKNQSKKSNWKKQIRLSWGLRLVVILVAAFLLGRGAGWAAQAIRTSVEAKKDATDQSLLEKAGGSWGLSFQEDGKPPVADMSAEEMAKYNAWYIQDTQEKVLYLTFDAGYENGNTPAILDALKKHNAPAAFFIVGHYLESSPDLVRRMLDDA